MLKILSLLSLTLILGACSTPIKQEINFDKLKPDERVYTGIIQVDLNGKTNPDLTCDLFLNSDIAPTIRLAADGVYQFKSIKKKLAFSKIACIHQVGNTKHWIRQSLDIERIKQPEEAKAKEVHNMGTLQLTWIVNDSEFNKDVDGFQSEDSMRDIGKLTIKSLPYSESPSNQ